MIALRSALRLQVGGDPDKLFAWFKEMVPDEAKVGEKGRGGMEEAGKEWEQSGRREESPPQQRIGTCKRGR